MSDIGHTTVTLDAGQWLRNAASLAGPPAVSLAQHLLAALEAAGVETRVRISVPHLAPDVAGPAAADPVVLVRTFADALQQADAALASQHLQVARGGLDATLRIAAGDASTATARLTLHLAPQPYH